jgi:hypothetical protein
VSFYYGFDGESISRWQWSDLWAGERHVAITRFGDVEVSTVWLGLDHNFGLSGPPIIYETLVFGGKLDGEMDRYSNRVAALAGHDQLVARVRDAEMASQRS